MEPISKVKVLELKQDIFKENEVTADGVRAQLGEKGILMINVMSSPGSGKTTVLVRAIKDLAPEIRVGVMECDIDASVDAQTVQEAGARSIQLHTGGMCHMDAAMTKQGLDEMGTEGLDMIFIENVGNLVCPAEYDTGAHRNITILSVPEGDDKPAKYPLMYEVCDLVAVNKTDALPVFDFSKDLAAQRIRKCNPDAEILYLSAKTGEGFGAFTDWLRKALKEFRGETV